MSEKLSLSNVDKKAGELYGEYKSASYRKQHNMQMVETPITAESMAQYNSKLLFETKKTYEKRMGQAAAGFTAGYEGEALKADEVMDENLVQAKTFAHEHADELHEVAVIQAHMDGVDINTENSAKNEQEQQ